MQKRQFNDKQHNASYQRVFYNENASFRHVFLQIPCKPREAHEMNFNTSKVYRYTNGGENASCFDSSQPWRDQNTSWT